MPIIKANEAINVPSIKILVYGDAGSGKTSLACSSSKTLLLDFDNGVHRAIGRGDTLRASDWKEADKILRDQSIIKEYDNIVFDTVATALDLLTLELVAGNPAYGNKTGGLSQKGWGALAMSFTSTANAVIAQGKNLILIAHAKEEKEDDRRYYRPSIPGSSKDFIARICDAIGYMHKQDANTYVLDFSCPERALVKDSGNLGKIILPNVGLREHRIFFSDTLDAIRTAILNKSEANTKAVAFIEEFQTKAKGFKTLSAFNSEVPNLLSLMETDKALALQCKTILDKIAAEKNLSYDKQKKTYQKKQPDNVVPDELSAPAAETKPQLAVNEASAEEELSEEGAIVW